MKFTVPGIPKPWQRVSRGKWGSVFDPCEKIKQTVAQHALLARANSRTIDLKGNLMATMSFYFSDSRRRDLDNLVKLVLDALNHVIYEDDSQIYRILASKEYCEPGKEKTDVEIHPI